MNGSPSTQAAERVTESSVRLYCLGGGEAPAELGADLRVLAQLPPEALQRLWQVLAASLGETIPRETEELVEVFCAAYKVEEEALGRAVKACRFVVREAARRDVPAGALAQDLERLCPGDTLVRDLVLAGYEPAKQHLRREILKAALADHGKLLVGLNWRLDSVQASERGVKLQMPVALLTLHYREGTEAGRVTVQVLPDMVSELKTACEKLLG